MHPIVVCLAVSTVWSACSGNARDSQEAEARDASVADAKRDGGPWTDAGLSDAAPSSDAGVDLEPGLRTDVVFAVADGARTAHVFVPNSGRPAPLIVLLHGNGGSADAMIGRHGEVAPFSEWLTVAEEEGLALLIPNGRAPAGSASQGWNDCRADAVGNPESDDVDHIAAMVDTLIAWGYVRSGAVFMNGHSNGGHFAFRLALERPAMLQGIAVVAASLPTSDTSECTDEGVPVPLLLLNGDNDPILPFAGGAMASGRGQVIGFDALISRWVRRNGLQGPPVERLLDRSIPGELITTRIEVAEYSTMGAAPVSAMRVVGGGHGEPSVAHPYGAAFELIVGKQSHDAEMARLAWAFFEGLLN